MTIICRKELRSYLTSMTGYVFIAFILLLTGIYFTAYNLSMGYPVFGYTLSSITFAFLIITPVLTMRVLAEETEDRSAAAHCTNLCGADCSGEVSCPGSDLFDTHSSAVPVPSDHEQFWRRIPVHGLHSSSGILFAGVRQYFYRGLSLFRDRESDHCGSAHLCGAVCLLYDERD